MRIIKNRAIINDPWRPESGVGGAGGDDTTGATGDTGDGGAGRCDHVILPLERWLALRSRIAPDAHNIGVSLSPEDEVETIAADLDRLSLIALAFGSFHEGRGYSQATQLRRHHHFTGEIRALGAHRDNLPLMERCGINAYQLAEGEDIEQALLAFEEITAYYPHSAPA